MALDPQQIKAIQDATGHSVFGSSSLPRIVECPASVGMELRAGIKPPSVYAAKGTLLHNITEKALRSSDTRRYVHSTDLSVEDSCYVLDAIDYVFEVIGKHPAGDLVVMTPDENGVYSMSEIQEQVDTGRVALLLEATGSLSSYGIPDSYGTADVVVMSSGRTDVIDHKFGHGVPVHAEKNYQVVAYLGMVVPFNPNPDKDHKLFVHINQPTLDIFEEWEVSWDVLFQMLLGDVTDAVALAKGDNPPYGPSTKACRFCNANRGCRARHNSLVGQARTIQEMAKNPSEVTNEQWAVFLDASEQLKEAINHIEDHAMVEIQAGNAFPGFKLVSGKSNRKFIDEEAGNAYILKRLGKKAYKPQDYISLAQAERLDKSLKDDETWSGLIFKPSGAPQLVRVSDKRPAISYGVRGLMDSIAASEE